MQFRKQLKARNKRRYLSEVFTVNGWLMLIGRGFDSRFLSSGLCSFGAFAGVRGLSMLARNDEQSPPGMRVATDA